MSQDGTVEHEVETPDVDPVSADEAVTRERAAADFGAGDVRTDEDAFGEDRGPGLEHDARIALTTLLTQRFITRTRHPVAWDALLAWEPEIRERLDDLFLQLEVDLEHEVAFKRQLSGDGVPVLLRRDRALSRDASLLLIHLRQEHAYHDALDDQLVVTRDQVSDFLNRFGEGRTHDQVALERRVDASVRALEQYHLLEAEEDDPDLFVVSPAVVPLVTPEVLAHLRDAYLEAAGRALESDGVEVEGVEASQDDAPGPTSGDDDAPPPAEAADGPDRARRANVTEGEEADDE